MARSRRPRTPDVLTRRTAFRPEYLDFDRGIRMGHLEPQERITQILKARLTERFGLRVICDRWGRGVYWQWICWVPEPNRKAKPQSGTYNFSSAKFFVAIDQESRIFQSGMQVERAPVKPGDDQWPIKLEKDWDWHVLARKLREERLPRLLGRLLREGFRLRVGAFSRLAEYDRRSWDRARLRRAVARLPGGQWGGLQLFWPMSEGEVRATSGSEIIDAVMAVFEEVTPVMNLCMFAPCLSEKPVDRAGPLGGDFS